MTALDLFLHLTAARCQLTRQGDTLRVHDPQHCDRVSCYARIF
jgi:hypothetical protein